MKRTHQYWVYFLASASGTLYIGITNDIYRRVLQHKQGEIEGFSKRYRCCRLVYYECFAFVQAAIAREKELKKWVRRKKIALVESEHPRWEDLAENWGHRLLMRNESLENYR